MCEILLRVIDRTSTDFYKNCALTKAGDVIVAQPDGWAWSKLEQTNPEWRILKFPGVPISAMAQFLSSQLPTDPVNPEKTLLVRAVKFDASKVASLAGIGAHASVVASSLNDKARKSAAVAMPAAVNNLAPIAVVKARVADPAIIGQNAKVVG